MADDQGDPETAGWTRGNLAGLLALRGELDTALGLAQRNYELTERLGDVFSRAWALVYLGLVQLERGEAEVALISLEHADHLYLEAMGAGGEAEAWRGALIAEALLGVGRVPDGLERAELAAGVARERGLRWSLPRALRVLAQARLAAGKPGANEALDEAEQVATANGQLVELEMVAATRTTAAGLA